MSTTRDEYVFTSGGYAVKSLNEIKRVAPSVFTKGIHSNLSDKYSRVDTLKLIKGMQKLGWNPIFARQVGEGEFGRHVIRLTNTKSGIVDYKRDDLLPQIIIDNSFDGWSPFALDLGIFRIACSNGLAVKIDGMSSNYSFRHVGIDKKEIKKIVEQAIADFDVVTQHIGRMHETILTDKQKLEFAIKALVERDSDLYKDDDGKIMVKRIAEVQKISELMEPMRDSDKGDSLWNLFNILQEKLLIGGYERISPKGRKITVPGIANPGRNLEFNRGLWTIAESYLN